MSVDVRGAERLLDEIVDHLEAERALFGVLADGAQEYEQELFTSSGHGDWAPLDPATVAAKGSSRVLVDTAGLLDLATSQPRRDGESVVVQLPPYARYLRGGARGMPKRDPAPQPRGSDTEQWAEQLLGFVVRGHR